MHACAVAGLAAAVQLEAVNGSAVLLLARLLR